MNHYSKLERLILNVKLKIKKLHNYFPMEMGVSKMSKSGHLQLCIYKKKVQ
jgi:hypothetical protein